MKREKILAIIEEKEIFTVKDENKRLLVIVEKMEKDGQLEFKDSFKDCNYYGKPDGRKWTLKGGFEND